MLQTELDAQRAEKAQLQQRLSEALLARTEHMAVSNVSDSSLSHRSETEWKQLEHRARVLLLLLLFEVFCSRCAPDIYLNGCL